MAGISEADNGQTSLMATKICNDWHISSDRCFSGSFSQIFSPNEGFGEYMPIWACLCAAPFEPVRFTRLISAPTDSWSSLQFSRRRKTSELQFEAELLLMRTGLIDSNSIRCRWHVRRSTSARSRKASTTSASPSVAICHRPLISLSMIANASAATAEQLRGRALHSRAQWSHDLSSDAEQMS